MVGREREPELVLEVVLRTADFQSAAIGEGRRHGDGERPLTPRRHSPRQPDDKAAGQNAISFSVDRLVRGCDGIDSGTTVELNMQSTPVAGSKRDLVSVLHADAREELKKFPDETFDCLITDPPYSVGITNNEKGRPRWDRSRIAFDPEFWALVSRSCALERQR